MTTIGPIEIAADGDDGALNLAIPVIAYGGNETNTIEIGQYGGRTLETTNWGFFRFQLPSAIPAGATINSGSVIKLKRADLCMRTAEVFYVYAELSASTSQIAAAVLPTLTSNYVNHDLSSWAADGGWESVSVVSPIQELVTTYGGLAQNAWVTIWIRTNPFNSGLDYVEYGVSDYSGGTSNSADLTIEYTAGGATIDQEGFRFRNDDGSESAATWKANQDTNITLAANTAFRLREILNATGDPASIGAQLEFRYKPSGGAFGSWTKVN